MSHDVTWHQTQATECGEPLLMPQRKEKEEKARIQREEARNGEG
jgi:hypothetical protein